MRDFWIGRQACDRVVPPVGLAHAGGSIRRPGLQFPCIQVDRNDGRRVGVPGLETPGLVRGHNRLSGRQPLPPQSLCQALDMLGADLELRQVTQRLAALRERGCVSTGVLDLSQQVGAIAGGRGMLECAVRAPDRDFVVLHTCVTTRSRIYDVMIHVDLAAPSVRIESPMDRSTLKDSRVRVSGNMSIDSAWVQVNGTRAQLQGHQFEASVVLEPGVTHMISVVATDHAGNAGRAGVWVIVGR